MDAYEAFRMALAYIDGEDIPDGEPGMTPAEKEHGPVVDVKWGAYGDWLVYEDGYEEYRSIGD